MKFSGKLTPLIPDSLEKFSQKTRIFVFFGPWLIFIGQLPKIEGRLRMLVLSRKKDETIVLRGPNMDDIKITIVRIDNRNKVRIGIEADKEITVLRSELTQEMSRKII